MKTLRIRFFAALALAALVGCEEAAKTSTPPALTPPPAAKPDAKADAKPDAKADAKPTEKKADAATPKKLTDDQIAEIKKLPEADQKLALAQMVCPIGEDNLGEMGMPVKVILNDKPVFLCCSGCEKKAKEDPAGTLAKLLKK